MIRHARTAANACRAPSIPNRGQPQAHHTRRARLLWELIWKTLWLSIVALPAWRAGQMDQNMVENVFACLLVVVIPIVMPWGYLVENYWKRPGDRWRGAADSPATRA